MLHLLEFVKHADDPHVPLEMTGEGIAQASWIDVRHVPQSIRSLIRDGLVVGRTSHVKGGSRRRKTYYLTDSGRLEAIRLRETVRSERVKVRASSGIHEMTYSEVLAELGGKWSILEIARRVLVSGALDLSALGSATTPAGSGPGAAAFVEMLQTAPQVDGFVGRRRDLEAITSEGGPRMIVVQGVAGIGKSWLGAKACELLHDRKNVFWHRVRTWDTPQSILAGVGDFLHVLGRPNLRSVIVRGDGTLARRILRDDLPGANALFVFDDAHEATPDILSLLRDLKDMVAAASDVRVLVLTRRSLAFYDRRDVVLSKTVGELDLRGLETEEFRALLSPGGEDVALFNIGRKLGGHPLLIELARSTGHPATAAEYLRDARRFLEEEVYWDLSEPQRRMMKLAALYRTPVPREALFENRLLAHDVLISLQAKALIRRVGEDAFEVHDTIRDYFDSILAESERAALGRFAQDQLRRLASRAEAAGNYPSAIDFLSNALRLPITDESRVALLEALGDAYQWIGDLPETLTAYKEGLSGTGDTEVVARLHRKAARALWFRGDKAPAWKEVAKGLEALGRKRSVERGWLELVGSFVNPSVHQDGDQPLPVIRNAIEIFREFSEGHGEAEGLLSLGFVLIHVPECDLAEGERYLRSGLELATSLSDRRLISEGHTDLVHFYLIHNRDVRKAMDHVDSAESSARDQDYFTRWDALYWKALAQTEFLSDFAAAGANLSELAVRARRGYDAEGSLKARHHLANVAYYRGEIAEARAQHEAIWRETKASRSFEFKWAAHSLWAAAECCLLQGDRDGFELLTAEAREPGVQEQITKRIVALDVLLGLAAFVKRNDREFESRFSHALNAAERAFKTREAPYQFRSYVVPYFYGVALEADGRRDDAVAHVARTMDILRTYGMKSSRGALKRDKERFVRTLREWAATGESESEGHSLSHG